MLPTPRPLARPEGGQGTVHWVGGVRIPNCPLQERERACLCSLCSRWLGLFSMTPFPPPFSPMQSLVALCKRLLEATGLKAAPQTASEALAICSQTSLFVASCERILGRKIKARRGG